ncbi:hypothetical protein N658DRAFT_293023 [Parathielavia hyrcaniae]|uniref:NACHT domain-containing protein n=1 Tax=Parathielavia hyrcaniae TaxID=113614 RepID=A0AAN6SYC8_9PEZI|nr:hypothetical protein N658DRAFT_293023 [Parathielavia hyrcaniae]
MEPFSALGFACNIVQFVDFSCKLFSSANAIYRSASGAAPAVNDATTIARTLHDLSSRLVAQPTTGPQDDEQNPRGPINTILDDLALGCRSASAELLAALDGLHARATGSRWSSFKVALLTVMKSDKLKDLENRLEHYRRQIIMALEILQSEQQSAVLRKLNGLYEANSRLQADMAYQISDVRAAILNAVAGIKDELSRQDLQTVIGRSNMSSDEFFQGLQDRRAVDIEPLVGSLSNNARAGSQIFVSLRLLKTLRFNSMSFRYSKVAGAHNNTFQWMFHNTFKHWLTSEHPIFWISGKPGSGKSTLMKFLVDHDDIPRYLAHQAGGSKVVIASYFFWINGTEMQKSQEGLLRSLLYDLLRQEPHLIRFTFPDQAQLLDMGYTEDQLPPWERHQLLASFRRLLHRGITGSRVCIFIDGLDEYEGEHEELIQIVRDMAHARVKLCISSRPWNIFEHAFGNDVVHKLYLEQFNRPDIELYVRDKLQSRPDFQVVRARHLEADRLILEIIDKAQGVFLWVYLVVRSLIQGLLNWDRIEDLQRRLRAFPSDLDDFFSHILESLDGAYRVQTARLFQVSLAAPRPLSLLNYWYIDMDEVDEHFLSRMSNLALYPQELAARQGEMGKRLNGRFKGLLEVTTLPNAEPPYCHRVDFLHRTVKDFLRTTAVQKQLVVWSMLQRQDSFVEYGQPPPQTTKFDPYRTLCKSSLAMLKSAPVRYGYLRGPGPTKDLISDMFFAAQQYEMANGASLGPLLDGLQGVILQRIKEFPTQQPGYPWANWGSSDFLTHAIKWNLVLYVRDHLLSTPPSSPLKLHLLDCALRGRFGRNGETTLGPNPQMVETILNTGPHATLDEKARFFAAPPFSAAALQRLPALASVASAGQPLVAPPEMCEGLYSSLMLLVTHNALRVKHDSEVWQGLSALMSSEELASLRRTQQIQAMRKSWNPFRRWFSTRTVAGPPG